MLDYITLGQRIRARRRAQNLTQEELARRVGISATFLGHIERGTRIMSLETLMALCEGLRCSSDALLGTEDPQQGEGVRQAIGMSVPLLLRAMADLMESKKDGSA